MHQRLIEICDFVKEHEGCIIDDVQLHCTGSDVTIYNNLASLQKIGAIEKYKDDFKVSRYRYVGHSKD